MYSFLNFTDPLISSTVFIFFDDFYSPFFVGKEYTQKRALEQHMRHHSHLEFPNYTPKRGVVGHFHMFLLLLGFFSFRVYITCKQCLLDILYLFSCDWIRAFRSAFVGIERRCKFCTQKYFLILTIVFTCTYYL